MPVIAVYNLKGGVGKTTTAVNLAWCSAQHSARRTLLWDLDPQGSAGFLLGLPPPPRPRMREVFAKEIGPEQLVRNAGIDGLDLLSSDSNLSGIEQFFITLGKKRRIAKLTESLARSYDRIVLDCPPILNETADQIIRAASLLVVPITPSPLALKALSDVQQHLHRNHRKHCPVLPVISMLDQRRKIHRDVLALYPDWPTIPMSSVVEQMGLRKSPVGAFAARSKPAQAYDLLWQGIEAKLARL
jgi:cellulose biosynthesis protein BcsQ